MTNIADLDISAYLYGSPPLERFFGIEPEIFVELLPSMPLEMRERVYSQLWTLDITTKNQRQLLVDRVGWTGVNSEEIENWLRGTSFATLRDFQGIDIDSLDLNALKNSSSNCLQITEFLEEKGPPTQLYQREVYTVFLMTLFKESLENEYLDENPLNPLAGILRLTLTLPDTQRERVLEFILSSLVSERSGSDDERVFFEVAPLVPDSLIAKAESVAREIHREWAVEALTQARMLPVEGMRPYQSRFYKWLGLQARRILEKLGAEEQNRLLEVAIQVLWEKHSIKHEFQDQTAKDLPPRPMESMMPEAKYDQEDESEEYAPEPPGTSQDFMLGRVYSRVPSRVRAMPPPQPPTRVTKEKCLKETIVNPGFAEIDSPLKDINRHASLKTSCEYFFWVEIGKKLEESIEVGAPTPLPSDLPEGALLKVAVFPFKGEMELVKGEIGLMRLRAVEGQLTGLVEKQAIGSSFDGKPYDLSHRLLFHVRTPNTPGKHRIRCNIYCKQVLLQSRVITAITEESARRHKAAALKSVVDFSIGPTLNARYLDSLQSQNLSLMLNDNGDGTHSLRCFTDKETIYNVDLDEDHLMGMITQARAGYRIASWGDSEPFNASKKEKYGGPQHLDVLKQDMVQLARRGWLLYRSLFELLDDPEIRFLKEIVSSHSHIEFIIRNEKRTSNFIIPVAILYDHKLNDGKPDLDICPTFLNAYKNNIALETTPCFNSECPSLGNGDLVCPSGFWGYRNSLGLPTTRTSDIDYTQFFEDKPAVCACVNSEFERVEAHIEVLKRIVPGEKFRESRDVNTAKEKMKEKNNLIYFYCHGDREGGTIYIRLGPKNAPRLSPTDLDEFEWNDPKPLIILNGCNTAALEAEQVLNFVQPFLRTCNAAGVIGTDIPVFESLATQFAENCISRFVKDGEPIGEAVRKTRIDLLQKGNPLGLVYVPYVHDGLRLMKKDK